MSCLLACWLKFARLQVLLLSSRNLINICKAYTNLTASALQPWLFFTKLIFLVFIHCYRMCSCNLQCSNVKSHASAGDIKMQTAALTFSFTKHNITGHHHVVPTGDAANLGDNFWSVPAKTVPATVSVPCPAAVWTSQRCLCAMQPGCSLTWT